MERRLAAILAADVVGYTGLMAADEAGTLRRLTELRETVLTPLIDRHHGRIVKLMGDGLLVEFASAVDSVSCALEWQDQVKRHQSGNDQDTALSFRIGVNLGDVIVTEDDIYGDGVNIASRLEGLAKPGRVYISDDIYRHAKGKVTAQFEDLGKQVLKNVSEPRQVYCVSAAEDRFSPGSDKATEPTLPDRSSIAVLPFTNMSGDPEQDYFADGMVEEIITALSRIRWLFVIARNSTFTYKGQAVNVRQVGRELGVRYILEGSVRKAGATVRITGQLIDTSTDTHIWADRFDGTTENVFDLQDRITSRVVGAIAPRLEHAEIERAKRKPTDSLDAYDYYLRGMSAVHQWNRAANAEALSMFSKAVELDPNFAAAYGLAARCYSMRKASGWMDNPEQEISETVRVARRAAELGPDDAIALSTAGIGLAFVAGELDEGANLLERALDLDRNLAWAWLFSGWVKVWSGEPDVAIEHVERGYRLSPHEPHIFGMQSAIAMAHFFAGRHDEALAWARRAMKVHSHTLLATCVAAASAALIGDNANAANAIDHLKQIDPGIRLSNLDRLFPLRRAEDVAKWSDALRQAGMAE